VPEINVPLNWKPRDYQMPLWEALERGTKRAVAVWHRRAGKDLCSINWTVTQALQRRGIYWHILPTYKQGRKIVWDGMTKEGRGFTSYWPEELIERKRDDEMSVWLKNGSIWQVVGCDDVDKLVGTNPVGCVFSEYSLQDPRVWDLLRPILLENGGWALFIYTPRGRNHGHKLFKMAQQNSEWFCQQLSVEDTHALHSSAIEEVRAEGMPEELVQQEFYCSFDAPLVGAYYADQLRYLHENNRIGVVPWDPNLAVTTAWDLGIGDANAIWFCQQTGKEVRLIEYYHSTGVGLDHYAKEIYQRPYAYNKHLLPFDVNVRELGSGKSRVEILRNLGIHVQVVPRLSVQDGIAAVRQLLPRCWFDEKKCELGIRALAEYTKEMKPGEQEPDGTPVYRDRPKHDWTSHPADAFRTLAVGLRPPREKRERLAPRLAIV